MVGTGRHDARRIDNQLRGRAGRQGDPGSSQFFLSLDDDILRIFGGDRIKNMMTSFNLPEDMPIESRLVTKAVAQAQAKVEGFNFDARKHLLEFDDVLNKQRGAFYEKRQKMLSDKKPMIHLQVTDLLWMEHLENMDSLMDAVRLRAYGQRDPLIEYRREGAKMFEELMLRLEETLKNMPEGNSGGTEEVVAPNVQNIEYKNVGRNDPCPCNSGLKYKKCHGK